MLLDILDTILLKMLTRVKENFNYTWGNQARCTNQNEAIGSIKKKGKEIICVGSKEPFQLF